MPISAKSPISYKRKDAKSSKASPKEEIETFYTDGMKCMHDNLIGSFALINGPFGHRRMTYADYTASGRNLYHIENYIAKYVYSYYGNTHTSTSFASMQTSKFRDDAKAIIRCCCNANNDDAVIFCGSGTTGAIHKLIGVLGLNDPEISKSTVIFIGPYEHHSNILPWKETGAKIVRIKENSNGQLNTEELESELKKHSTEEWNLKIGTFSACSNVTGLLVDTIKVSQIMHKHGGLAFWDYAAGAPYLKIDMNPITEDGVSAHKDAMFCSPHKFVGGPGSPGLLIAKKKLFKNQIPHGTGGGTVVYVTSHKHGYTRDIEAREEGGTPAIIESIRAGLAFQMKHIVGYDNIHKRENYLVQKGISMLTNNPNIILLGSKVSPRIPIFSICIRHPVTKKLLHHNFVALLLNDLFGIQARAGCACAGPYAQDLLGIAEEIAESMIAFLDPDYRSNSIIAADGKELPMDQSVKSAISLGIMKPGFVRFNLGYFMPDAEVEYILNAVNMVANHGWKLLPQYAYDVEHGSWHHRSYSQKKRPLMSLLDVHYTRTDEFNMSIQGNINKRCEKTTTQSYSYLINEAEKVFAYADVMGTELFSSEEKTMKDFIPEFLLPYIWWLEPHHAMHLLDQLSTESLSTARTESIPIKPRECSGPIKNNRKPSDKFPRIVHVRGQNEVIGRSGCPSLINSRSNISPISPSPDDVLSGKHEEKSEDTAFDAQRCESSDQEKPEKLQRGDKG